MKKKRPLAVLRDRGGNGRCPLLKTNNDFIEIGLKKPTQLAHSDSKPRCRPIIENVVDCGDRVLDEAAKKQLKLTENKENGKPVLAARTTARRKGNSNIQKG